MKLQSFLIVFSLLICACQTKQDGEKENGQDQSSQDGNKRREASRGEADEEGENKFWEPLVWKEYRDQNGVVFASMPFPPDWKFAKNPVKGEPSITGPNGIVITDFPIQSYIYTIDQRLQQAYYQSGQQLRYMPGIDPLIQQDFIPWAQSKGMEYVRHYEIPEVTKVDKWYSDQLFKAVPGQSEVVAIGTEWKKADETPYFLLIHINMYTTKELQNWYYICTGMEAEKSYFETAKKQLIFALSNTHYPLEPIQEYNRNEAIKAGRSWDAFNQRMAQNQANFEAQQRAFVNKSNAINDAIMNGWRARNETSDRIQEQTIDGIYERTNVVDPSTGQRYKVAAGANQYWMNRNGEYISSDQQNYNPNLDENLNRQHWQELQEVK